MKLPKRIAEILNRKQEFIDSQRDRLENTVIRQQAKLFSEVVNEMIPGLDVKNGIIQESVNNYQKLSALDGAYKNFTKMSNTVFLNQMAITTGKIAALNEAYFKIVLSEIPNIFPKIIQKTDRLMNLRIGLDGGKLVRGGYLESFFNSNTIGTELKNFTSKAVTSQMDMKDYINGMRKMITGTEDKTGLLERQFQRYAYDLYQQYDAAYNQELGTELGFNYFIYQGGLIKDSREFCREHNNKVYSIEETEGWATWKSPTTGETPSYLGYPGYDPLIDRGGYNCRHSLGWISDELAEAMRS